MNGQKRNFQIISGGSSPERAPKGSPNAPFVRGVAQLSRRPAARDLLAQPRPGAALPCARFVRGSARTAA